MVGVLPALKSVVETPAYVYYGCTSFSSSTCNDANRVALSPPSSAGAKSGFGNSVSVSGDTIVVGAYQANNNSGAAFVYYAKNTLPGTVMWIHESECAKQ